jgi:uncharacterized protein (TIGR03437 family)
LWDVDSMSYSARRLRFLEYRNLMRFLPIPRRRRALLSLSSLAACLSFFLPAAEAANIGTVVPVSGTVADLIYDSARNLVYLANSPRNEVDIYSVNEKKLVGSIPTGTQPSSLALSPDRNTLYAANIGSNTITSINLNTRQRGADYTVGSRPDAIAVGNDGKVLILGTGGLQRLDPGSSVISTVPVTPPVATPTILPSVTPFTFFAGLVTTASGNLIIGLSANPGLALNPPNRLFVYEVASGTVLRSRNVSGLRPILSASTDGSRFMAGPYLFDTQTLTILGRTGTSNAALTGGSTFSVDGNAVYATFSTQPPINPLNPNNPQNTALPGVVTPPFGTPPQPTTVLQILRSSSLTPQFGLRLPEAISSKIIASSDGQNLFANSTSGLLIIPIGQLTNLPILDVSATNVVLSRDMCNRTIATASVQIRNLGGGRMTFAANVPGAAPVILNQRSGIAPATLTISFDPRTSTARGTSQYVVALISPEAVNIEPAILVNLNFRDVSDRGTIIPINGVGVDLQMDAARQRLYIANYTQDQIEVFSLASQTFLPPIRVGNRPMSMAMANPSTLVVANWGSENLSVVDLDAMQEVDEIPMGPVPINNTPLFPRYIAASSNAILFSAVQLPATVGALPAGGSIWQLSLLTRSTYPRLDLGTSVTTTIGGHSALTAAGDGSAILVADANITNNATLRLYDPIADTFPVTRTPATATTVSGFRGAASGAADGSYYVVDNTVFNSVLGAVGTLGSAFGLPPTQPNAAAAFGAIIAGNSAIRVQFGNPPSTPSSLQRFNLSSLQLDSQVNLAEAVMDITPAQMGTPNGTRQWPPRAVAAELGVNGQTQIFPRGMAVDGSNNVYLLTLSGLSVVSLTPSTGRAPSFTSNGVLNTASRKAQFSPGSLITILGSNLANSATTSGGPLPRFLGGVCVTANEVAIPLISTSPTEIDAQLPTEFGTGRVTLTVRSPTLGQSSTGVLIALNRTSPAVFSVDAGGGQQVAAIIHGSDFALVTTDYPAERDETIILYTTGLGAVDPNVASGELASADPLSKTTEGLQVSIGGRQYPVLWSGLSPYMVGIYQINLYVPGDRTQGDNLPVVVTAGGISSATDDAPLTAVH